ncbi:polyprenyl synthetase family protein [Paenibacillus koleovorans]|uniref:polyprenyl synthetase family protein n=1 Tax=Paenibacillus koleovorans TaxID=121608 RepID=UPI000FDC27B3|nr:polyprenyl synthetase family protein [Paenibacillus koleovorans]
MQGTTLLELNRIADRYWKDSALNGLLRACFIRKAEEKSIWGELTTTVHRMFRGDHPNIATIAAISELLLLALDVADDLQDEDNPEVPWMQCPRPYALNAVLALIFGAVGELDRCSQRTEAHNETTPHIHLETVSALIADAIRGQQTDLMNEIQTEEQYIEMIRLKSGSLVKLACYLGYRSAGVADPGVTDRIDELAVSIGMYSQIRNDARDIVRWDQKNDLLKKKKTLPVLFLLADTEDTFSPFRLYYEGQLTLDQLLALKQDCMTYIEQSGCIEYCKIIQSLYRNRAHELIDELEADSEWKARFRALTIVQPPLLL